jgi:cysteine desulfurase
MSVYLDHNATTPLRPEAAEAMRAVLAGTFGNPSSAHRHGAEARSVVERAREQVAALVGAPAECIVFTSSATEANNAVLLDAARRAGAAGGRIVTCASEHPSILEPAEELRAVGLQVVELPVDADGRLDPDRFAHSLDEGALLASVMWVNNETGVVQPIAELARIARERHVPFHSDAVQALGKLPLALERTALASAAFSAHTLGGPKGIGALYVAPGARVAPLLRGGPQERRRRAGTENVPGIAGFGAACAAARADLAERAERLGKLRDRLWHGISAAVPGVHRNGSAGHSVTHTLNVAFEGCAGEALVAALDLEDVAVASGAACHAGSTEPSHVLLAMGLSPALAAGSIRFSLGFDSSAEDVERVLSVLPALVARARAEGAR